MQRWGGSITDRSSRFKGPEVSTHRVAEQQRDWNGMNKGRAGTECEEGGSACCRPK